jgi:hypothetical protein
MRRTITIATLALLGALASIAPASAQYYGPGYGQGYGYGPGPDPYYRPYRAPRAYAYGYAPRRYAGDGDFLRPRFDPRVGGFYCVDPRFTVQSGVCKPYRGF